MKRKDQHTLERIIGELETLIERANPVFSGALFSITKSLHAVLKSAQTQR